MKAEPPPSPAGPGDYRALLSSVSKANGVVASSLHRAIRRHLQNDDYDAKTEGLDFLQVKNGLMMSYLIDLTLLLRLRLKARREDGPTDEEEREQCLERLLKMKTALEKLRPLERRMRYQIDKLLALSTLGAGTFAANGREEEEEDDEHDEEGKDGGPEKGRDDGGGAEADGGEGTATTSDPLSFKPDLRGMMKMFEEDGDERRNDGASDAASDAGDDDDDQPNVALEADDDPSSTSGVYQPPRLQSAPYEVDDAEARQAKEARDLERQRERQSRSELAQMLRDELTDAPETEDVRGGTALGRQSARSRNVAARTADTEEFEETHMIRLSVGKKERKERKRAMREEMSNLGAIAGGWGGVVAGVDDAFGGERGDGADDGAGGGYKVKGMRRRRVEVLEEGGGGKKRKKRKGAANAYQKSLYGGGDGGGKSKKKR